MFVSPTVVGNAVILGSCAGTLYALDRTKGTPIWLYDTRADGSAAQFHGEPYDYYPLGKYIVAAPGVCGGRPTVKYHRLDAMHIIGFLERGDSPKQIALNYRIPIAAVREAIKLASIYDYEESYS